MRFVDCYVLELGRRAIRSHSRWRRVHFLVAPCEVKWHKSALSFYESRGTHPALRF